MSYYDGTPLRREETVSGIVLDAVRRLHALEASVPMALREASWGDLKCSSDKNLKGEASRCRSLIEELKPYI